jgi:hypothetical protein
MSGAGANDPNPTPDPEHRVRVFESKRIFWASIIGSLALVVVALIALVPNFLPKDGSKATPKPTGSSPVPSSSKAITPPSLTPSESLASSDASLQPESSPSAEPQVASQSVKYLSDVEGTQNKSATLVYRGQQHKCLTSLMVHTHIFQKVKTFEYAIDPEWDTFSALAGIDIAPPSGNTMRFTVYVDDIQAAVYSLPDRQAQEISVSVHGKSNLKLVTETQEAGGTPVGGYGAWGNARFTKGSSAQGGC